MDAVKNRRIMMAGFFAVVAAAILLMPNGAFAKASSNAVVVVYSPASLAGIYDYAGTYNGEPVYYLDGDSFIYFRYSTTGAWNFWNMYEYDAGVQTPGNRDYPEIGEYRVQEFFVWTDEIVDWHFLYFGSNQAANEIPPRYNHDPKKGNTIEPINTMSGFMVHDETDIVIPCPGFNLTFARSYRSGLPYTNSGLGPRWAHSFDWHISETTDVRTVDGFSITCQWAVVKTGQGDEYTLTQTASNQWNGNRDNNWRAERATNGEYSLYLPRQIRYAFNSNGILTGISDSWSNCVTLTYTNDYPSNLLTRAEHNNGQYLNFSYQSNLISQVTTPSTNLTVYLYYNTVGELSNATRRVGTNNQPASYYYDATTNHSITQIVDSVGDTFKYVYTTNASGWSTSICTNMTVSSNYYVHSVQQSTNAVTTVTYYRGATNQVFSYVYNSNDLLITQITGPTTNQVKTFQYADISKALCSERIEDTALNEYLAKVTYYQGIFATNTANAYCATPSNYWLYTWDTNWQVMTSVTDPEGSKIEMEYTNGLIRAIKTFYTASNSHDAVYVYITNGLLSSATNANGHWIQNYHNNLGFLTSAVPQAGITVNYEHSQLGYLTKIRLPSEEYDPSSNMIPRDISYDVDEIGRTKKIYYLTNGPTESFAWDANNNITNHIDRGGKITRYTYRPTGKLASVSRVLNGTNITTSIDHDNQFNVLKITDAKGRAAETYGLDLQDRVTTVTNLENQTMTNVYGIGNMVKQITRFDGTTVSNAFNSDGLISSTAFPGSTNSYTYLRNNLLKTAGNETCTVSNSWSMANRLTNQLVTGLISSGLSVGYTYLPAGNVSNITSVVGTETRTYDAAERISGISATRSGLTPLTFNFSYNDTLNGLISEVVCTNTGVKVTYGHDTLDRVTSIIWTDASNNILRSFTYTLNSAGMITEMFRESGENTVYTYDDLYRLVREKKTDSLGEIFYDETNSYDEVGNRTSKIRDGITVSYSYSNNCNRLTGWLITQTNLSAQVNVSGYADENIGAASHWGQLWVSNTVKVVPMVNGSNFWAYDFPMNLGTQQLAAAIRDDAGNTTFTTNTVFLSIVTNAQYLCNTAGCVTNISYSGESYSRNIGLTFNSQYQLTEMTTNGVSVERNGFDALGRRVWNWNGNETNYFVYDGVHILAEVDNTGGLRRAYTRGPGVDNWFAMTIYTGVTVKSYFYLTDHQGTVHAIADETGVIVESYRYDAWGRVLGIYNGSGTPLTESVIGNRILWQGREYSWKTGLYYFRARWYDPITGRWFSNDPIGISGGLNQYVFCADNPVNCRDAFGFCLDVKNFIAGAINELADQGKFIGKAALLQLLQGNIWLILGGGMYWVDVVVDNMSGTYITLIAGGSKIDPNSDAFVAGSLTVFLASMLTGEGEASAAKSGAKNLTYLYQKMGAEGEHLKFGITKNPATRYTQEELAGGQLRIMGQGSKEEMLQLERKIHETLPIGPEEAQKFYIQKQVQKGLKPPPY